MICSTHEPWNSYKISVENPEVKRPRVRKFEYMGGYYYHVYELRRQAVVAWSV
jgi:hypothetical protein